MCTQSWHADAAWSVLFSARCVWLGGRNDYKRWWWWWFCWKQTKWKVDRKEVGIGSCMAWKKMVRHLPPVCLSWDHEDESPGNLAGKSFNKLWEAVALLHDSSQNWLQGDVYIGKRGERVQSHDVIECNTQEQLFFMIMTISTPAATLGLLLPQKRGDRIPSDDSPLPDFSEKWNGAEIEINGRWGDHRDHENVAKQKCVTS